MTRLLSITLNGGKEVLITRDKIDLNKEEPKDTKKAYIKGVEW